MDKPTRSCDRCGADITGRHHQARICFDCLYGRKPGAPVRRRAASHNRSQKAAKN